MYKKLRYAVKFCAICLALVSQQSIAQTPIDSLGNCLADNTSGKDRKELAKWIFAAMSTHPEMKVLSSATAQEELHKASKSAAALFTRLMAETCAKEVRAAVRAGGPAAIESGFQVLGKVAMQELMTHPDVRTGMDVLDQYIDRAKVEAALQPK